MPLTSLAVGADFFTDDDGLVHEAAINRIAANTTFAGDKLIAVGGWTMEGPAGNRDGGPTTLPAGSLAGAVALVSRGNCTFALKGDTFTWTGTDAAGQKFSATYTRMTPFDVYAPFK